MKKIESMHFKFNIFMLFAVVFCSYATAQTNNTLKFIQTDSTHFVENDFYPITFKRDSLFAVGAYLGPYSPAERAQNISERLERLVHEYRITADSFKIIDKNNYSIILYRDFPLLSVSEADAELQNETRQELATQYISIIKDAFGEIIQQHRIKYWITRILYTLFALAGLVFIFVFINRLFKWIDKKLLKYEDGLKQKRKSVFRYLAPRGPDYFFLFLSRIVKIALIVFILIFYIPLIFSFLPWTKDVVSQFYEIVSQPLFLIWTNLVEYVMNHLIFIVIIFFIARYVLRILTFISKEIESNKLKIKGFHREWAKPTFNIVKILVYAFSLVFMFPHLPGSNSPAFKGVSIFLGVLFSLGSTSAIANIVAGIVITYMRPFQLGDRVKIGETVGDVIEKNLLVTRLKTVKNEDITIPNATIINAHLWNYSKNASNFGIILHPSVTIGYDVPSETVVKLLLAAAKNTKNLTREFKPFVLHKGLNDFYVEYELNVYTKQPGKMAHFYSELNKNILAEFNKAKVEILSPHYTSYRDGNPSTIPGEAQVEQPTKNPVTDIVDKITGKA